MILLAARGDSVATIAAHLGTSRSRVHEWLGRFPRRRLRGLVDRPRSGRPPLITSLERHQVVAAACQAPSAFGVERNTWTRAALAEALVKAGLVRAISPSAVAQILEKAAIRPHRVKAWCHSNDPEFQPKMRAIVRLYVRRPPGEPVLCIDEKTGIQALSRLQALKPATPRKDGRQSFEYRRNGTRCLFACFNVGTGQVLGQVTERRTREDFLRFMDRVAATYRQPRVHVILDNLNTHHNTRQGQFMSDWNRRHGGRFVFHYTPTHGSWLNQVELWFGIMARRVLRYGDFHDTDALVTRIASFMDAWNIDEAHPFRWTYQGTPLVA